MRATSSQIGHSGVEVTNANQTRFLYLEMAAMILTAALAVPEAAPSSCADFAPGCLKGYFQGEDTHLTLPPGAPTVVITTTATGTARVAL